jgi:hypothetical protein
VLTDLPASTITSSLTLPKTLLGTASGVEGRTQFRDMSLICNNSLLLGSACLTTLTERCLCGLLNILLHWILLHVQSLMGAEEQVVVMWLCGIRHLCRVSAILAYLGGVCPQWEYNSASSQTCVTQLVVANAHWHLVESCAWEQGSAGHSSHWHCHSS